jgi:hypothetical protein
MRNCHLQNRPREQLAAADTALGATKTANVFYVRIFGGIVYYRSTLQECQICGVEMDRWKIPVVEQSFSRVTCRTAQKRCTTVYTSHPAAGLLVSKASRRAWAEAWPQTCMGAEARSKVLVAGWMSSKSPNIPKGPATGDNALCVQCKMTVGLAFEERVRSCGRRGKK